MQGSGSMYLLFYGTFAQLSMEIPQLDASQTLQRRTLLGCSKVLTREQLLWEPGHLQLF